MEIKQEEYERLKWIEQIAKETIEIVAPHSFNRLEEALKPKLYAGHTANET